MKEKFAYCALDYEAELQKKVEEKVWHVGEAEVRLRDEQFRCTEILFQPSLLGQRTSSSRNENERR